MKTKQTATYWGKGGRNGYGEIEYLQPKTIKVRWEDKQELFRDELGEDLSSRAVVYTLDDIEYEGYLYLGESDEIDPANEEKAFKIRSVSITPNISNTKRETKAWLWAKAKR